MKRILRLLILVAVIAAAGFAYWRMSRPEVIPVVLTAVDRGTVESTAANTRAGTVKACRRSKLSPATGGQVATLNVREGDRVKSGEVMVVIWNKDVQARVELAESNVLAAESRIREACLKADQAEREAKRQRRLLERGLAAEERVDQANTNARALGAACQATRADLAVSRAEVAAARAALELTILKAPFDGVVAEVNGEIGEFITPSPIGVATPPAVDLIDDDCVYVTAPIDEVDAPAIEVGMPACLFLDAFPEPRCGGWVRRIAPYVLDVEKQARTVEVEAEFGDKTDTQGLLPGYSADIEIVLARRDDVPRVPTEAVLEGTQVLVYRETDGTLEARRFEAGLSNWRFTEVVSGLEVDERVVVSVGREGVEDGALAMPEETSAENP